MASNSRKALPESVSGLLDVAIFSFGCQSGLRSYHKVRGDPILEGVTSFFGRMLLCSSPQTLSDFESIPDCRLGGWKPRQAPSQQLLTLVSSRLKALKAQDAIRENGRPVVPQQLLHKEQWLSEDDRLKTRFWPKCWRCGTQCAFCERKKESFPNFGDFRVDTTSPFLEVVDKMLEDNVKTKMDNDNAEAPTDQDDEKIPEDKDEGDDEGEDEDKTTSESIYQQFLEISFPETDNEDETFLV